MQRVRTITFTLLAFWWAGSLAAQSIYYFQDFSSTSPTGWNNDGRVGGAYTGNWDNGRVASDFGLVYGRVGVVKDNTANDRSIRVLSNNGGDGRLTFRSTQTIGTTDVTINSNLPNEGQPNSGSGIVMQSSNYLGLSLGRMALYDATSFDATPTRPVGWQIMRFAARLDSDVEHFTESHRHANRMSFYVFDSSNEGNVFGISDATFTNIISMYETYRSQRPTYGNSRSTWGYYTAAENEFNLAAALRPDGQIINLNVQQVWWRYDDQCSDGTSCNIANAPNNNVLGLRIATDGQNFYFYINPDADNNDGLPNEYILVGQTPATFSSSLKAMIGVESERYDTEMQWAEFDNFLIRSVTDGNPSNTRAEIHPTSGRVGQTATFDVVINPTINPNDAGIAEIRLRKPASFTAAWDLASVEVYSAYGTGVAHPDINTIQKMSINNAGTNCNYSSAVTANHARICASGNDLIIRFRATNNGDNNVIRNATSEKRIAIRFNQVMPNTPNIAGEAYLVFVGNEKYDITHTDNTNGNTGLAYATTGWQRVAAGDALAAYPANTLVVTTVDIPTGFSSVVPSVLYVGFPQDLQNFIATPNDPNNSAINKLEIEIYKQLYQTGNGSCVGGGISTTNPDCYVDDGGPLNLSTQWGLAGSNFAQSLIDNTLSSSLTSGNTRAVITYNTPIPGSGGLDKVTLSTTNTPVVLTPTYYRVKVKVFNTNVSTTSGNLATTGTLFSEFSQFLQVRPPKPIAIAKISPTGSSPCSSNAAAYGPNPPPPAPNNTVCNTINTNQFEMLLTNNGNTGNNIRQVRINLPDVITAIPSVSVNVVQGGDSFSFTSSSHPGKFTFNNVAGNKYLLIVLDGIGSGNGALGLLGNTGAKRSAVITLELTDSVPSLSGSLPVTFSGFVENGNGDALTDNSYTQDPSGTLVNTWVNPYARGKAEVLRATGFSYPIGNPTGERQLYNTSSDDVVQLSYRVFNPSVIEDATNVDNGIRVIEITVPSGFTGITGVTSVKGGSVAVVGNVITVSYASPIPPGDFEQIDFTVTEQFYNNFAGQDFISRVANVSNPNASDWKFTSHLSALSREIVFVNQPLNAVAYVEVCHFAPIGTRCSTSETADNENQPTKIDISLNEAAGKVNKIRYYIKNTGLPGAYIRKWRIYPRDNNDTGWSPAGAGAINSSYLSATQAFTSVTGYKNGSPTNITCTSDPNYSLKYIECDFESAGGGIDVGDVAYIEFDMRHTNNMPANETISFRARGTNALFPTTFKPDTETYSSIAAGTVAQMPAPTYPEGSTESIKIQVSKPLASAQGFFTLTNTTNSSPYDSINALRRRSTATNVTAYYYLKNTGVGTNYIYKARIGIPTTWIGKVTVTSPSNLGANVSIVGNDIVVNYDPANNGSTYLPTSGANQDFITLTLSHDVNIEDTSTWSLSATNDFPPDPVVYDPVQVTPLKSRQLHVVKPALLRLTSSQDQNNSNPGNPIQLYTTNTNPQIVLRIANDNTLGSGRAILRARVSVPNNFVITAVQSSILGSITPPASPNPIEIIYPTGLPAGNLDDIIIAFKKNNDGDPFDPGTHSWQVRVIYDDSSTDPLVLTDSNLTGSGGDFLNVSDSLMSGASLTTQFILPPLPAQAYLSVNTNLFNNRANHLGLNFPGWGNLDGDNNPPGDTLNTSIDDGGLSFIIANTSTISGNDIRYVKITAPTAIVSNLSKVASDVTLHFDPNGTNVLQTGTVDATCNSFAQDYCIVSSAAAHELVLILRANLAIIGKEIRVKTNLVRNPSLTTPSSGAFVVQVSNDPAGNNLQTATTPIAEGGTNYNRSLTLFYYEPTLLVQKYVEKRDSSAGLSGNANMLYKTETEHNVNLFVRNSGHATSRLTRFTVQLPSNVFQLDTTNDADGVSNFKIFNASNVQLTGGAHFQCVSGCNHTTGHITAATFTITLAPAHEITANSFVKVELINLDTAPVADGGSNPYPADLDSAPPADRFQVSALANTGYTAVLNAVTLTGKSDIISLMRPQPAAVAYIFNPDSQLETTGGLLLSYLNKPDNLPVDYVNGADIPNYGGAAAQGKRLVRIIVENTGTGQNNIRQIKVKAPAIFTGLAVNQARTDFNAGSIVRTADAANPPNPDALVGDTFTVNFNPGDFNTSTKSRAILSVAVNYTLLNFPDTAQQWQVIVKNDPAAADCFTGTVQGCQLVSAKIGQTLTHSFIYPPAALEFFMLEGNKVYSVNTANNSLMYSGTLRLRLQPKGVGLAKVALKLPVALVGTVPVVNAPVTSEKGATVSLHNVNSILALEYPAPTYLQAGDSDIITIPLGGIIPHDSVANFTVTGRYIDTAMLSTPPFDTTCETVAKLVNDLGANGTSCMQPVVPDGFSGSFSIVRAPFANLKANILPLKDVYDNNLVVTASIQNAAGNILNDFNGNPLVAQSDPNNNGLFKFIGSPVTVKDGTITDGGGIPMCSSVDGTGCSETLQVFLNLAAPGYKPLRIPLTLTRSLESHAGLVGELELEPFKPQSGKDNLAIARDSSNARCLEIQIPDNGVNEVFSVAAECTTVSTVAARTEGFDGKYGQALRNALQAGKQKLQIPANVDNLAVYVVNIRDAYDNLIDNIDLFYRDKLRNKNEINVESRIKIKYDAAQLAAQGYAESGLAVFTYDLYRGEWVKLGGVVDEADDSISAQIASLNRYYLVAGAIEGGGLISDVTVTPRLFTPGQGSRHFNRMTLQFNLNGKVDKYEVGIFDMSGKMVTRFEKSASLGAGQIFWDGYDNQGNLVKSGIYVYVIRAGKEKYRGTIVVVR